MLWGWFIHWWLGDEKQFTASIKARPISTTLKTLIVIVLSLVSVWVVSYVSTKADNYAENRRAEEVKSRLGFNYTKATEVKNEETRIIKTTFELTVYMPPFFQPKNPEGGYNFEWYGDPQAKCKQVDEPAESIADFGYTASTTRVHIAVCETHKYIIDNGRLWKLVEK